MDFLFQIRNRSLKGFQFVSGIPGGEVRVHPPSSGAMAVTAYRLTIAPGDAAILLGE
jgi:hypothetical protein